MTTVSPIAEYLRINKAITKHDKNGCHFFSPEGLYLGRMTKSIVNNYKVITLETFGENFKKMYTKSIAIGQQFIYLKNLSAPIGVSIVPIKTLMRKIFVDHINQTSSIQDTERSLKNDLNLIDIDEATNVGLFDTEKPFIYNDEVIYSKFNKLKHPQFKYKPS